MNGGELSAFGANRGGAYRLERVYLEDQAGNSVIYGRDGSIVLADGPFYGIGEQIGTHTLDFSAHDFDHIAWPYRFEDEDSDYHFEVAPALKKFRVGPSIFDRHLVRSDPDMRVLGDQLVTRYDDDNYTYSGTFDLATGRFAALYRRFTIIEPMHSLGAEVPKL